MSFLDRFKSKENRYAREDRRLAAAEANARLAKHDLERENRLAQAKTTIKESRSKAWSVRHPYAVGTAERFKGAGRESLRFIEDISNESAVGYGVASARMEKEVRSSKYKRGRGIRAAGKVYGNRSFARPDGGDTSLSQSIARADWSGERNVMNTQFFGERDQRDYTGNQSEKKWDMDIFGTKTTEVNLLGGNKNLRQNKKFY